MLSRVGLGLGLGLALALAACSSKSEAPPPPPPVIADAGVDGITAIVAFDPASGMHLDDDSPNTGKPSRRAKVPGVPIGILLKSEPTNANVSVDGEFLGVTPKYWSGSADGTEHVFAFTKANYALAHYKFVPIASGVLHATLVRVASGETPDGGLEPVIAPTLAPDAGVAPPPTVLTPPVPAPAPAPPRPQITPDAAALEGSAASPPAPSDAAAAAAPEPTGSGPQP